MAARVLRRTVVEGWQAFWFQQIPSDIFSSLRIAFGLVGLAGVVGLVPVSTFWTPGGLLPASGTATVLRDTLTASGLGEAGGWVLFLALLVSFICMAAGVSTWWSVACCFVGSVLQSFWNPLPLSAAHDVLTVMLFYLLWADCSGAPSVDAWLKMRRHLADGESPRTQGIAPIRLMRIQVALIYMNSALWKLGGPTWRDGSTIHYVLNLNTYQRFPGGVPVSLEPLLTASTYLTLFWEMTFGLMLFNKRTRKAALLFGVAIHLGLWVTLELGEFSWVMLASYIAFLDPERMAMDRVSLTRTDQKTSSEPSSEGVD